MSKRPVTRRQVLRQFAAAGATLSLPAWSQNDKIVLGPVVRADRTRRATRHPDAKAARRCSSIGSTPPAAINGTPDRAAHARRRLRARSLQGQHREADQGRGVRAVRLHRNADSLAALPMANEARCRSSSPSPAPRHCAIRSAAMSSMCGPRISTRLRRSSGSSHRGPQEDRRLPPERQLRQGRPHRRAAGAQAALHRSRWRSGRSSATRSTWPRRCRPSCRAARCGRADQRLQELRRVHS